MKKILFFLILMISLTVIQAYSENRVLVEDRPISRYGITLVPVLGSVSGQDSAEVLLRFNGYAINIEGVIGGEGYCFGEIWPDNTIDSDSPASTLLSVSTHSINPGSDTLFVLKIRGLLFDKPFSFLEPVSLTVDGINDTSVITGKGKLTFGDSEPIFQEDRSDVGLFYPSPFSYETKLEIYVDNSGEFRLDIFNLAGIKAVGFPEDYLPNELAIYNQAGESVGERYAETGKLDKGRYTIVWRPDRNVVAQGPYYALIGIGGKKFKLNLMIQN